MIYAIGSRLLTDTVEINADKLTEEENRVIMRLFELGCGNLDNVDNAKISIRFIRDRTQTRDEYNAERKAKLDAMIAGGQRMDVRAYTITEVGITKLSDHPDERMMRFKFEFDGITTKAEFDRFALALSDGTFQFKRLSELGDEIPNELVKSRQNSSDEEFTDNSVKTDPRVIHILYQMYGKLYDLGAGSSKEIEDSLESLC